jgi:diguanylate cyclase (GGDEF)-like protein/PAS domain S-box-containing protein
MWQANSAMSSGVSLIDVREADQPLVYVNAAFERLTGYSAAEVLGRSWKISQGPDTDPETTAWLDDAVRRGKESRVTLRHRRRDGATYWCEMLMAPVHADDGSVTHYMSVQKDITERTEHLERAAHLAYHDALTGLPNRARLDEHLSLALARAGRNDTALAIVFFDLDLFKQVNDRHGHESGDRLLAELARRWRSVARSGDALTRFGGDEFVLLITDIPRASARETAAAAVSRYADALNHPFELHGTPGETLELAFSSGIAVYPQDGTTPEALLLAADTKMYARKRGDRNPGLV